MNLHKIDKPFGELDDATKGALMLAAHNGAEIEMLNGKYGFVVVDPQWASNAVYRVRPPTPVVVPKTFHGTVSVNNAIRCSSSPHAAIIKLATFTFPTIDGKHIAGVYTSPAGHTITIEVAE